MWNECSRNLKRAGDLRPNRAMATAEAQAIKALGGVFVWTEVFWFTPEQFRTLEEAGGVVLDDRARSDLQTIVLDFMALREVWETAARTGAVRKLLADSEDAAAALLKSLEVYGSTVNSNAAAQAATNEFRSRCELLGLNLDTFINQLSLAKQAAAEAVASFPEDRGGEAGSPDIAALIRSCHEVFVRVNGRSRKITWDSYEQRYKGQFLNFMSELLTQIGEARAVTSGLGKRISRALMDKT